MLGIRKSYYFTHGSPTNPVGRLDSDSPFVEHRGGLEPPTGVTTTTHYAGWPLKRPKTAVLFIRGLLPQINLSQIFSGLLCCSEIYYSFIVF